MLEIHRWFRAGFAEAGGLVRGVSPGDVQHADVVGGHLAVLSAALHSHHEFEDGNFWGTLASRAPACALHVDRMKRQHAEMLVHLQVLDGALPLWRATATEQAAAPILAALAGINAALAAHLPDEEDTIVPVMAEVLEPDEVAAAAAHGRKAIPRAYTFRSLGAIMAAQPDGGTDFLRRNLPAPARLAWRLLGRRQYEAHRAALRGGRGG